VVCFDEVPLVGLLSFLYCLVGHRWLASIGWWIASVLVNGCQKTSIDASTFQTCLCCRLPLGNGSLFLWPCLLYRFYL